MLSSSSWAPGSNVCALDPLSDIGRAILEGNAVGLAAGQKVHRSPVDKCHVPQNPAPGAAPPSPKASSCRNSSTSSASIRPLSVKTTLPLAECSFIALCHLRLSVGGQRRNRIGENRRPFDRTRSAEAIPRMIHRKNPHRATTRPFQAEGAGQTYLADQTLSSLAEALDEPPPCDLLAFGPKHVST